MFFTAGDGQMSTLLFKKKRKRNVYQMVEMAVSTQLKKAPENIGVRKSNKNMRWIHQI